MLAVRALQVNLEFPIAGKLDTVYHHPALLAGVAEEVFSSVKLANRYAMRPRVAAPTLQRDVVVQVAHIRKSVFDHAFVGGFRTTLGA
jgi:hypothetical protein